MESLLLFRRALSSPTMCRFIPALSVPGLLPSPGCYRVVVTVTGLLSPGCLSPGCCLFGDLRHHIADFDVSIMRRSSGKEYLRGIGEPPSKLLSSCSQRRNHAVQLIVLLLQPVFQRVIRMVDARSRGFKGLQRRTFSTQGFDEGTSRASRPYLPSWGYVGFLPK